MVKRGTRMNQTTEEQTDEEITAVVGDTPKDNIQNPFHLHFSGAFREWIAQQSLSMVLSTYEGAKLIIIGPGMDGRTSVTERNFERCMALCIDRDRNIYVSSGYNIWQLENGLEPNHQLDGWDRIYLPRKAYITGSVDIHDLALDSHGKLLAVVTQYNCIGEIDSGKGSFSPVWRPSFISEIIAEDRCHLNGFCLNKNGAPAFATAVAATDENNAWRGKRKDGGIIIDIQNNKVVAEHLSMPHTPRLHKGKLYFLEAGTGWFCTLDPKSGKVERLLWRPGFLRGLRFKDNFAFLCSSEPRDETFAGLPLQDELEKRGTPAQCALEVIDLNSMEVIHSLQITGAVKELYDVAVLENCRQPLLYGIHGDDVRKIVVLGKDRSDMKKPAKKAG